MRALLACAALAATIAFTPPAFAQFSLSVTQVGRDLEEEGDTYPATCTLDACRATLPVRIGRDACVLNVRVGAPNAASSGTVLFAAGPCESRRIPALEPETASARYWLDRLHALSTTYTIRLTFKPDHDVIIGFAEAVTVRLDIVGPASP